VVFSSGFGAACTPRRERKGRGRRYLQVEDERVRLTDVYCHLSSIKPLKLICGAKFSIKLIQRIGMGV
jgi:hypothetical protein